MDILEEMNFLGKRRKNLFIKYKIWKGGDNMWMTLAGEKRDESSCWQSAA